MNADHDPFGRGLPPGPLAQAIEAQKHVLPPKKSGQSPAKRRLKAFRIPLNYLVDAVIGYQGKAEKFNAFRIKPGLIPEGFTLAWVAIEHSKQNAYIVIEHPSFPEYTMGTTCEEIAIQLEEFEVQKPGSPFDEAEKLGDEMQAILVYVRHIRDRCCEMISLDLNSVGDCLREIRDVCDLALNVSYSGHTLPKLIAEITEQMKEELGSLRVDGKPSLEVVKVPTGKERWCPVTFEKPEPEPILFVPAHSNDSATMEWIRKSTITLPPRERITENRAPVDFSATINRLLVRQKKGNS